MMDYLESMTLKEKDKALRIRQSLSKRRPDFVRQESWRYKRVKENWRRPRGIDSKMRKKVKGWPRCPEVGYRGPKDARGLHPSGYEEVLIYNLKQLDKINPKVQAIKVAHNVGSKKRKEIIAKAKVKGIYILNLGEMEKKEEVSPEVSESELEKSTSSSS